uniref:Protein T13F3.8, confirmed by transcript evidence n=1 Tax=Solanum tuberosum TaxID=4113 RepID=M1BBC6_SOLTU
MTTTPVSHSNPKGKEKEKEKEEEEEEEEKEKEKEEDEKEKEQKKKKEKEKEKEKVKKKAKEKERKKNKEKKVEVVSCDVKRDKDDDYLACSDLEFKQLDFVFAFPKKKDWFFVMSQPNKCRTHEAWTFEVIPHLTHQVNAEEEISSPRILRWLRSKTKISKNIPDLYNPPHDAQEPSKETELLMNWLFFMGGDGCGIDAGVGQDQGATSYENALAFSVRSARNKMKILSCQEEEKILYQGNTKFEEEDLWRIANGRRRGSVGVQHVNAYKCVTIAEKNKLVDLTKAKELCAQYDMHYFSGEDFRTMTSIDIWWEDWYVDEILSLMREMHVRYPEYYDSTDRILDLNFYSNFKVRYDKMSEEATTVGGRSITQLINEFEWDEDMINYVRGIRPYPGGMDWIGAKRLLAVMNLNKTHFVALEILLHVGRMNVYDCLLMGMEHAKFLTFI